jgi:hypothetical protein
MLCCSLRSRRCETGRFRSSAPLHAWTCSIQAPFGEWLLFLPYLASGGRAAALPATTIVLHTLMFVRTGEWAQAVLCASAAAQMHASAVPPAIVSISAVVGLSALARTNRWKWDAGPGSALDRSGRDCRIRCDVVGPGGRRTERWRRSPWCLGVHRPLCYWPESPFRNAR